MSEFGNTVRNFDHTVKLILTIIGLQGFLVRITADNIVPKIVAILQIFTGDFFGILWLVDIITFLTKDDFICSK